MRFCLRSAECVGYLLVSRWIPRAVPSPRFSLSPSCQQRSQITSNPRVYILIDDSLLPQVAASGNPLGVQVSCPGDHLLPARRTIASVQLTARSAWVGSTTAAGSTVATTSSLCMPILQVQITLGPALVPRVHVTIIACGSGHSSCAGRISHTTVGSPGFPYFLLEDSERWKDVRRAERERRDSDI